MRKFIFLFSVLCVLVSNVHAQELFREVYISWDDFAAEYLSTIVQEAADEDGADAEESNDLIENLIDLAESPMNINDVSKAQLMQLPFLAAQQAEAIIAYREQRRRILSLGELQFVRELDFKTRRYLSLFVYAGATLERSVSLTDMLKKGEHELSFTAEVPFYKRAGFYAHDDEGTLKPFSQIYQGAALKHVVRHRYKYGRRLAYGFTLEQDAGEAFPVSGVMPYDYATGYVRYASPNERWRVCLGDYKVSTDLGLLLGRNLVAGRLALINGGGVKATQITPHTGMDEHRFFRGAAVNYYGNRWHAAAFLSYRRLDARLEDGCVTSLQISGLHRTTIEQERRANLGALTMGGNLSFVKNDRRLSLNAYVAAYEHPFRPAPSDYSSYYLHGKRAAGVSLGYAQRTRRWQLQTEVATDHGGHLAATGWVRYMQNPDLFFTMQGRWLANRFRAPYAKALTASSRTQGEQGLMVGLAHRNWLGQSWRVYVDAYRLTAPTFRAERGARGVQGLLQTDRSVGKGWLLALRYQFKAREQRISGYHINQWIGKHHFCLQTTWNAPRLTLNAQLEATARIAQAEAAMYGWLAAVRTSLQPLSALKMSALLAYFQTDDYAASLYAYEPQLKGIFSFNNFYYQGCRVALIADWQPTEHLALGVKYGLTHYLDRSFISSGAQMIAGPTKADLQLQLRLKL